MTEGGRHRTLVARAALTVAGRSAEPGDQAAQ
jgi:hypothetical protein